MLARGGGWTTADEGTTLLTAAGIRCAKSLTATTCDEAVLAAASIGYPVVLKALGPALLHKTERRAVALNLANATGVRAAFEDFTRRLGADMSSVLVQEMLPTGIEMIVGSIHDPSFGPLIACGTGGVLVDILADSSFRLHPLTASDAHDMVNDLRGARLLRGFRGAPAADEAGPAGRAAPGLGIGHRRSGDQGTRLQSGRSC